ncbi:MAG TPA: response regulator [Verrucomicrobiae bacterium]|jgi:CheY-like chemotaxis protein
MQAHWNAIMILGFALIMYAYPIILLAEDDEDYVHLIKQVFDRAHIPNPIHVVWNGEEAIAYLKGEGKYSNREEFPLPDIILLDLKMPRVSGLEVLRWVKQQPGLSSLRVLVLTSSEEIRDVNEAYQLGANSFLVKPLDFHDLTHLSRLIVEFWVKASRAPETFRPPRKIENHMSESNGTPRAFESGISL